MLFGSAILMGTIFSPYYPYLYSLPAKYGVRLHRDNSFNSIIFYAVGEAGTCAIIGELMAYIHPLMLFIVLFGLALINWVMMGVAIGKLER